MSLMLVAVLIFMLVVVLILVMSLGNRTVTLHPIEASAKIQCCKTKIIRSEEAQCRLSRVNRCHKGFLTDN